LAIYWMAHHRQFHYIKHSDRTLLWINIVFLMATCLLPFSTSLIGEYMDQEIAILVYGGNSIIIASLLYIQWWYATTSGRLVDENLNPVVKTASSRRLTSKFSNRMHKSDLFIICVFYGQQGYHKFV
jgi:uncharacterized membrane protein